MPIVSLGVLDLWVCDLFGIRFLGALMLAQKTNSPIVKLDIIIKHTFTHHYK